MRTIRDALWLFFAFLAGRFVQKHNYATVPSKSSNLIVFARLRLLMHLPCSKVLLPLIALIESVNIQHKAPGDGSSMKVCLH